MKNLTINARQQDTFLIQYNSFSDQFITTDLIGAIKAAEKSGIQSGIKSISLWDNGKFKRISKSRARLMNDHNAETAEFFDNHYYFN